MIAAVVLSQTLFKHYHGNSHREFSFGQVWSHCWETAALAQCYCREHGLSRQEREEAFLAGLLHETGRLILMDNFPAQYQGACDAARRAGSPLGPHLREVFQAAPCEIASYLLDLWGMPDSVVAAVSLLEHPEKEKPAGFTATSAFTSPTRSARGEPRPIPFSRRNGTPPTCAPWAAPKTSSSGPGKGAASKSRPFRSGKLKSQPAANLIASLRRLVLPSRPP